MIYHHPSVVGFLLWVRYGLFRGKPRISFRELYGQYLESPGTKAYTDDETADIFRSFANVKTRPMLSFGDLLEGAVGQRHNSMFLAVAKKIWPRWLIRRFFPQHGLMILIDAQK
jgi:hypothetical protein